MVKKFKSFKDYKIGSAENPDTLKLILRLNGFEWKPAYRKIYTDKSTISPVVQNAVYHATNFNLIVGVIPAEDDMKRLVLDEKHNLYLFNQETYKDYNYLDVGRVCFEYSKNRNIYGSDDDHRVIWFFEQPRVMDIDGFNKHKKGLIALSEKNGGIYNRKFLGMVSKKAREHEAKEAEAVTRKRFLEKSKDKKRQDNLNKHIIHHENIEVKKFRIYDRSTRERLVVSDMLATNYYNPYESSYRYGYHAGNIKGIFSTLSRRFFHYKDGMIADDPEKLKAWLEHVPTIEIDYLKNEVDEPEQMVKRKIRFGISWRDYRGRVYSNPHYLVNGYRVPKDRLEIVLRYFLHMTDADFNELLKRCARYTVRMLNNASGTDEIKIEVPVTESIENSVTFTLRNSHNFKTGKWRKRLEELDVGIERKEFKDVEYTHDTYYGNDSNWVNKVKDLANFFKVDEEKIIDYIKKVLDKRMAAILKGEMLYKSVLERNAGKIFKVKDHWLVKGKLGRYKVTMTDKDDGSEGQGINVYTYPSLKHICIVMEGERGRKQNKWDRLVTYFLALLNDHLSRNRISTLGRGLVGRDPDDIDDDLDIN